MMRAALILALLGTEGVASELPALPSGLTPELMEELVEVKPDGVFTYARFRFLVPDLTRDAEYDLLTDDFMILCQDFAYPKVKDGAQTVDRIVISYSDRALEFGEADPEAVQFFEQFALKDARCIWEQY